MKKKTLTVAKTPYIGMKGEGGGFGTKLPDIRTLSDVVVQEQWYQWYHGIKISF